MRSSRALGALVFLVVSIACKGGMTPPEGLAAPASEGGSPAAEIATWSDEPGACPKDVKRVDLARLQDLLDASRGEGAYAGDPPETCYLIKNGTYVESGSPVLWVKKGGSARAARRFVGESRAGVVIRGRANIASGSDHVVIENLTFDLTGFRKEGSFNTVDIAAKDVTISHVTATGDCATGAKGGHIEVTGGSDVVIDSCIVEKFGRCNTGGHEDHGVYLSSGTGITVRNSDIRGNSSRGILINTQQGSFGKLNHVVIERNRIHDNGHANYEDGIAVSMQGTGNVDDVTIRNNLIYGNYYSGLRFVGTMTSKFDVHHNTFYANGEKASGRGRSNLNLDDVGCGANTIATRNIFAGSATMLNNCYDATARGFSVKDNLLFGADATGGNAACIGATVKVDPQFVNAAGGDFHTKNAAAAGYGAY